MVKKAKTAKTAKKVKTVSINSMLIGQDLAELVERLSYKDTPGAKMLLLVVSSKGLEMAGDSDISPYEAYGMLYMAMEQVQKGMGLYDD